MRALIDYHHTDLAESLHRLLEDRLNLTVYVPHGLDWFAEGYWQFGKGTFGDDRLGRQFLLAPEVDDLNPDRTLRRLTLEEARGMDFDVVVATVPDNYQGYARFAREKGARFVQEVGNVNQRIEPQWGALILDSTGQYPGGLAFTPEFDIDGAFGFTAPEDGPVRVSSFVNLFPDLPCFPLMRAVDEAIFMWGFKVYGHNGPDGFIKPTSAIAEKMRESAFIWHDKVSGDGYGYVIHYAAAVGRPLIGHASHYRGQVAADLWEDGVTCIDLDIHSPAETARLMEEIVSDPARHGQMCATISERVRARIDFAADAERVADALGLSLRADEAVMRRQATKGLHELTASPR